MAMALSPLEAAAVIIIVIVVFYKGGQPLASKLTHIRLSKTRDLLSKILLVVIEVIGVFIKDGFEDLVQPATIAKIPQECKRAWGGERSRGVSTWCTAIVVTVANGNKPWKHDP
jgi:hypothetical protein